MSALLTLFLKEAKAVTPNPTYKIITNRNANPNVFKGRLHLDWTGCIVMFIKI